MTKARTRSDQRHGRKDHARSRELIWMATRDEGTCPDCDGGDPMCDSCRQARAEAEYERAETMAEMEYDANR